MLDQRRINVRETIDGRWLVTVYRNDVVERRLYYRTSESAHAFVHAARLYGGIKDWNEGEEDNNA